MSSPPAAPELDLFPSGPRTPAVHLVVTNNAAAKPSLLDVLTAAARAPKSAVVAPVSGYAAYVAAFEAAEAARPVCRRCQGEGFLREYAHNGGVCFACGGYVRAVAVPMTEAEWLAEQAAAAGFEGFAVMVQR